MRLEAREIAIWTVALDRDVGPDDITAEERARAAMAIAAEERHRRVRARSALRRILGLHAGAHPLDLVLSIEPGGKPHLAGGPHFNLSHCGDVMLVAVCSAAPVGIDVERHGRLVGDWHGVAERSFSWRERMALAGLPVSARPAAALRGWVRKEAYAKARGAGFAYGFPAFSVSLATEDADSSLIEDEQDTGACEAWRLRDVTAPHGHIASLAHACDAGPLRSFAYEDLRV